MEIEKIEEIREKLMEAQIILLHVALSSTMAEEANSKIAECHHMLNQIEENNRPD